MFVADAGGFAVSFVKFAVDFVCVCCSDSAVAKSDSVHLTVVRLVAA